MVPYLPIKIAIQAIRNSKVARVNNIGAELFLPFEQRSLMSLFRLVLRGDMRDLCSQGKLFWISHQIVAELLVDIWRTE